MDGSWRTSPGGEAWVIVADLTDEREPQRVREFYEVRAKRIEPVGLVYLWPETN